MFTLKLKTYENRSQSSWFQMNAYVYPLKYLNMILLFVIYKYVIKWRFRNKKGAASNSKCKNGKMLPKIPQTKDNTAHCDNNCKCTFKSFAKTKLLIEVRWIELDKDEFEERCNSILPLMS